MAGHFYLTIAEIGEIHRQLIDEFGGSHGVRDQGALESAVYRPQTGYYNNLVEQAAALMESLANNHPFLDGNKRVSFAAADTFLRINGYYLEVEAEETNRFINDSLARGHFRFGFIRDWIWRNLRKMPNQDENE